MVAASSTTGRTVDPSSPRLRGIEGLRALAVLGVVVYHNWLYTSAQDEPTDLGLLSRFVVPHLRSGVTLFFVLSGFLLYRPIASRVMNGEPLPSARRYYRNRALRVLPAYWVILLATAVVLPAAVMPAATEPSLGRLSQRPTALIANVGLVQNYFDHSMDTGILPAWSLAVEVAFYAVLPLLGMLASVVAARASTRRGRAFGALTPPALMFIVGTVAGPTVTSQFGDELTRSILGRSLLNHADLFALGLALAVLMVRIEDGDMKLPVWWRLPAYVLLGASVLVTVVLVDEGLIYTYIGAVPYELLTGAAAVLLLGLVALPSNDRVPSIVSRIFSARLLVAVGLISYSLFLWHEPLQRLANERGLTRPGTAGFWASLLLIGGISIALATVTYRYVEKPALDLKRRTGGSPGRSHTVEMVLEARQPP